MMYCTERIRSLDQRKVGATMVGKIKEGLMKEMRPMLVLEQWFGLDWYRLEGWILLLCVGGGVGVSESTGDNAYCLQHGRGGQGE